MQLSYFGKKLYVDIYVILNDLFHSPIIELPVISSYEFENIDSFSIPLLAHKVIS